MSRPLTLVRGLAAAGLVLATLSALQGCVPVVLGSAVGGAFVATDRRTSGTQLEDQGIELKGESRVRDALGDRGHVNVNSYSRTALLTGEVPNEADKVAAEQAVARVENVKAVINELSVSFSSSLSSRSNDVLLAGKVRATLVDAKDLMSNAFKIVVERGEVYLMGMVTQREADRAAELTAGIKGVRRVVKVMDIISEEALAGKVPAQPDSTASSVTPGQGTNP
ncbi:MAG: hypothetical protein RI907_421 [Pseudomonadota bacterium]|jgi:osmotically-inducible protein OsmY